MKMKVTPRILSGFMELTPAEQIVFNKMSDQIRRVFENSGFIPLDTPVLELSEILLAKAGGETEKQIYRFTKGDTDMCLRFDLTVPLSRYVAMHQNDLAFPFKRYHIAKSYRGERPQKGRFREFYQADIDIIGSEKLSVLYDAEVPAVMYRALMSLGVDKFHIRLNNRKLMKGFYAALELQDKSTDILRLIDKADKIGIENVRAELQNLALNTDQIDQITAMIQITGSFDSVLKQLKEFNIQNELYLEGMSELRSVCQGLCLLGVPESHFSVDLKITRGLDYYTGTVYETFVDDHPTWGAICSGGRYDNLAGHYTDRKLPGVGMSIGLTRLFDLLKGEGMLSFDRSSNADVLVLPMGETSHYALEVTRRLRENGIKTEIYLGDVKFKNKMTYANKIQVPFVIILGEDEVACESVTLKNMRSGSQESLPLKNAVEKLIRECS